MKEISKPQETPEVPITVDANQLATAMKDAIVAGIQELKKPDPEVAKKQEEEKAFKLKNQEASAREQQAQHDLMVRRQTACPHQKGGVYQGQHTLTGQIHSDGLFHPVCQRCSKEFLPFAPGPKTIPGSETVGSDNCKFIHPSVFERWGKEHVNA